MEPTNSLDCKVPGNDCRIAVTGCKSLSLVATALRSETVCSHWQALVPQSAEKSFLLGAEMQLLLTFLVERRTTRPYVHTCLVQPDRKVRSTSLGRLVGHLRPFFRVNTPAVERLTENNGFQYDHSSPDGPLMRGEHLWGWQRPSPKTSVPILRQPGRGEGGVCFARQRAAQVLPQRLPAVAFLASHDVDCDWGSVLSLRCRSLCLD